MIGYFVFILIYINHSCQFQISFHLSDSVSYVEVILRLGPDASSDSIQSLQISIKENDGELELSVKWSV